MSEQTDLFAECYIDDEEADYFLPITEDELPTIRAAIGMWEERMVQEEDEESRIIMNEVYNRLSQDGLREA